MPYIWLLKRPTIILVLFPWCQVIHQGKRTMEQECKSFGRVVYDPKRPLMKSRNTWWCVLEPPVWDETTEYYRWWIERNWWDADSHSMKRRYHRPTHRSHMTIIRGEKPKKNIKDWNRFMAGDTLKFTYTPSLRETASSFYATRADQFWFLEADFPEYNRIRKHFGLPWKHPHTDQPFRPHWTVVRTYD